VSNTVPALTAWRKLFQNVSNLAILFFALLTNSKASTLANAAVQAMSPKMKFKSSKKAQNKESYA
jgi:hypothetical protein